MQCIEQSAAAPAHPAPFASAASPLQVPAWTSAAPAGAASPWPYAAPARSAGPAAAPAAPPAVLWLLPACAAASALAQQLLGQQQPRGQAYRTAARQQIQVV